MQLLALLVTFALDTDATRAALYRIDLEARLARLHPDEAAVHAHAADRQARDVAARLGTEPALALEAEQLRKDATALSDAARQGTVDSIVRDQAMKLELEIRRLDLMLPPPPPAR
jgi:hypothetical protein